MLNWKGKRGATVLTKEEILETINCYDLNTTRNSDITSYELHGAQNCQCLVQNFRHNTDNAGLPPEG